jgi:hypothetical protein
VLLKQVHLSAVNLSAAAVQHSESVFTFVAGNAGWVPALLLFVLLALPLLPAIRGGKLTREHRILLVWGAVFLLSFFSIPFLWVAPMGFVYFLVYGRLLDLAGRRGGT